MTWTHTTQRRSAGLTRHNAASGLKPGSMPYEPRSCMNRCRAPPHTAQWRPVTLWIWPRVWWHQAVPLCTHGRLCGRSPSWGLSRPSWTGRRGEHLGGGRPSGRWRCQRWAPDLANVW